VNITMNHLSLEDLDEIHQDTLVLHHFVEDRPLKGLAGFVDWRLNGRLSEHIIRDWTGARVEDVVLMPGTHHLNVSRILLMGLGTRENFDGDVYRMTTLKVFQTLGKLGVTEFALSLPDPEVVKMSYRKMIDVWLTIFHQACVGSSDRFQDYDICFVVPKDATSELAEPIRAFVQQYAGQSS